MELLREWFEWGQSDLFFYGIFIIAFSMLLPWNGNKARKNHMVILVCLMIYAICELIVTFWFWNWVMGYIALFVGGIALSAAFGRLLRMLLVIFLKHRGVK